MTYIVTSQARRIIKPGVARLDATHPLARHVKLAVFDADGRDCSRWGDAPTPNSAPVSRTTQYGRGMDFDGTDDYYDYPSRQVIPTAPTPFTVVMRTYLDAISTYAFHQFQNAPGNKGWALGFSTHVQYRPINFGSSGSSPFARSQVDTGASISTGVWHDIAIDYNGGTATSLSSFRCYWNGVSQGLGAGGDLVDANLTRIGANGSGASFTNGVVDYCVVLSGVAVADQLAQPEQVLALVDRPSRTYFIPTAGGGPTTYNETVAESFSFVDLDTKTATFARTLAEALSLVDLSSRAATLERSLAEALSLVDFSSGSAAIARTISESLSLTDLSSRAATLQRALAEALSLTDALTKTATLERLIAESLALTDTAAGTAGLSEQLSESLSLTDTASVSPIYARQISESLSLVDVSTRTAILNLLISESLSVIDSVTGEGGEAIIVATGGGSSMTLRQMRRLEREQLLAMIRDDDEIIIALVSQLLAKGRRLN
jgi:hypothetical protein